MTTATEDPAAEHVEGAQGEPEHVRDEPLSYVLLTPADARETRVGRIRELEREHYRLGLHLEEGEQSNALVRERDDLIRLARHHAVVLGLIEPPEPPTAPDGAPSLPGLPDGDSEPAQPAQPPSQDPEE